MRSRGHVAVLMGGKSRERAVSLASGAACATALEQAGYRVTPIDVDADIAPRLLALRPDVAFNALHGPQGEDGTIQGLLEMLALPYTHSGVRASALAMDKVVSKLIAAEAGIPVAVHRLARVEEISSAHVLPTPYVVKPVADGSSVGITIVPAGNAPPMAPDASADQGRLLMVEEYIGGLELTCSVLGDQPLCVTEIFPADGGWYDYESKYEAGGSRHICPAQIDSALALRICEISLRAHAAIGCRGATRSDFRYDPATQRLIWLEINTQPGMTATSLLPEQAAATGMSFPELVSWMVADASLDR